MFKLQSPSKYSPFHAIHRLTFLLLKTVFELTDFDFFQCFCCFSVSPLPHQQNVSLWGIFPSGKQKKSLGWDLVNREGGVWGSCCFVKNSRTLRKAWAGALVNYPSWNGQMCWKSLQKKFTEAEHSLSQQGQLVHWYGWVPRTLT